MTTRRDFLKYSGTLCALKLGGLPLDALADVMMVDDPLQAYPYRAWEDFYRKEFAATRGNSQGFAFHCSNCQGNCAFRVFAKDGVIQREEQLARIPADRHGHPRPQSARLQQGHDPFAGDVREGPPALSAEARRRARRRQMAAHILGPGDRRDRREGGGHARQARPRRAHGVLPAPAFSRRAGAPGRCAWARCSVRSRLYPSSAVGDMFTGATLAYGIPNVGTSLDAWFEMDYIVLWGINPNVTRIPDAHYLWEGKYNKAKIVVISPDYNPTAIHADWWIPIKPGSDSFLAMSLVQVVLKEKLYKEDFIREQTDLPFLVRARQRQAAARERPARKTAARTVFLFLGHDHAQTGQGARFSRQ